MSLFPAYGSSATDKEELKNSSSLDWLQNESCPLEVGTQQHTTLSTKSVPNSVSSDIEVNKICESSVILSDKEEHSVNLSVILSDKEEHSVNLSQNTSPSENLHKKNKKKKKKKDVLKEISTFKSKNKSKKKSKKRKRLSSSHSRSPSRSVLQSRSRSSSSGRSISSHDHSKTRNKHKNKCKNKNSQSHSRSNSRSHSSSHSKSYSKSPSRSHSRSRSRSFSKHYHRSKKYGRKKRSYSQSKSRSVTPKKKVKYYSRSRSRSVSHRSRLRSRSRSRSRSKESYKTKSTSRKYAKKHGKNAFRKDECGYVNSEIVSGSKSVFLNDIIGSVKPMEAFYIDTNPDKNNLAFNVTHYTQLARYKTFTKRIFGNKTKAKTDIKKCIRYFQKKSKKYLYCDSTPISTTIKSSIESTAIKEENCYISLELTYSESKRNADANLSNHETSLSNDNYTVLEDKEQTSQTSHELVYEYWHNQLKTYNKELGKYPNNVNLWLEFVRFQDRSFIYLFPKENKEERNENKKKLNQKALAERKISILDSAIKKNFNSVELQFERLEVGQEIWDEQKLKNEWSILVFNNPNSMNVWCNYLAFVQTNFSIFNLPFVVKTFEKCTEKFQSIRDGSFLSHISSNINRCLVDIAFQLAHVWQKAGYRERGIALFQALCEINLFTTEKTKRLAKSLQEQLTIFEPFWDSRAKRFGETGALGWVQVMKQKNPVIFPELIIGQTHDEEDDILSSGGKSSELWAVLELSREKHHWLPWEKDPEDCEDPERMVSLEEILPHLFVLEESQDKVYLVLQFLHLLGLQGIDNIMDNEQSSAISSRGQEKKNSFKSYNDIFKPLRLESFHDLSLMENNLDMINNKERNFFKLGLVGPNIFDKSSDMYFDFACNIIHHSFSIFKMPHKIYLAIAYIKLLTARYQSLSREELSKKELKLLQKTNKKQVKKLLKLEEFRTCLQLYLEYGHLESTMGQIEEAKKVYSMALSLGTQSNNIFDLDNPDLVVLLKLLTAYIQLEVQQEKCNKDGSHYNKVLNTVCKVVTEGKFNSPEPIAAPSASILKARKKLQELVNSISNFFVVNNEVVTFTCKQEQLLVEVIMCLALIQLATVGLKPACLVYETVISNINNASDVKEITLPNETKIDRKEQISDKDSTVRNKKCLEKLYENYAWFLEASYELRHLTINMEVLSPSEFRTKLKSAMDIAPENVKFILLFTKKQGWRDVVFGSELNIMSIHQYSIEILLLQLLPQIKSTIHLFNKTTEGNLSSGYRLENLLETAVSSSPGRNCPLLWRLYLQLVKATRPSAVRPLLYRAITNCPSAKSMYIDAIKCDGGLLRELCKLMAEKGVRVRMPLEELQVLTECNLDEDQLSEDTDTDQQPE